MTTIYGEHTVIVWQTDPIAHMRGWEMGCEFKIWFCPTFAIVTLYVKLFHNSVCYDGTPLFNTLRLRKSGRHFPDVLKWIFLNENVWILIEISLKFVPRGPINNMPALVQIMAWRQPGNKPFSEPMMVSLLTRICVTRPQWLTKCTWQHVSSLVAIMACCLLGTNFFLTNADLLSIGSLGTTISEIWIKIRPFSYKTMHLKCCVQNDSHLFWVSMQ